MARKTELEAWAERQVAKAPRLGEDPKRAARIARALGLTAPAKTRATKDRRRARQ